jgi:uncharacterized protein YbbK (DUF523 family)
MSRPIVAVSACLLGEKVRYDGDDRRDDLVADDLGRLFDFVPVCPEVEAGFGVPRETMQLEGQLSAPRLITVETRIDQTDRMLAYATAWARDSGPQGICGAILKKGSPSCGPAGVRIHRPHPEGNPVSVGAEQLPAGVGLFAQSLRLLYPDLPMTDEEMLQDPVQAKDFVDRVMERWRGL